MRVAGSAILRASRRRCTSPTAIRERHRRLATRRSWRRRRPFPRAVCCLGAAGGEGRDSVPPIPERVPKGSRAVFEQRRRRTILIGPPGFTPQFTAPDQTQDRNWRLEQESIISLHCGKPASHSEGAFGAHGLVPCHGFLLDTEWGETCVSFSCRASRWPKGGSTFDGGELTLACALCLDCKTDLIRPSSIACRVCCKGCTLGVIFPSEIFA